MAIPEVRYARAGDYHLAYQVLGDGPIDLLFVSGLISHCEHQWEWPSLARSLQWMASFSRLIWFDKRGVGMSDPVDRSFVPSIEQDADDLGVVLDEVGSERATLLGVVQGAAICAFYAASRPSRVSQLVMHNGWARFLAAADYPIGVPPEMLGGILEGVLRGWGTGDALPLTAPTRADDAALRAWWARWERLAASPGQAQKMMRVAFQGDIRSVLPAISVPTLVIARTGNPMFSEKHSQYLAGHVAGAHLVELPGPDVPHFLGDTAAWEAEFQEFVTGHRTVAETNRALKTILFTDIVGSTEQAVRMGDERRRDVLAAYHREVERQLERHGGTLVDTAGDGSLATFDGPARAIQAARDIRASAGRMGIEVRNGVHTGEVELANGSVRGIAVHIASRVSSLAGAGEILATRTVGDLVSGSAISFVDRGTHELKGVPQPWQVLAVVD